MPLPGCGSGRYTQWVHLALPWTLFANLSLMAGIALGGYWAYETLSFGGYWAWDPVENTSLVPWIISVAAIHAMVVQRQEWHQPQGFFPAQHPRLSAGHLLDVPDP